MQRPVETRLDLFSHIERATQCSLEEYNYSEPNAAGFVRILSAHISAVFAE